MNCFSITAALGVTFAAVTPLAAQGNAQCDTYASPLNGGPAARNVCNAALDGAAVFTPVAGILVTGGNPFLGSARGLGGVPHLGLTLRANATRLVVPDVTYNGEGATVAAKQSVTAPAPLIEAAVGLFRGTRAGSFAVDLLGSAQLLPTKLFDDVHIDVNAQHIGSIALGLGYGARVTVIAPHGAVPGVTASIMRRALPRVGVGDLLQGDNYSFASDLHTTDYRITTGVRLGPLALGAGVGRNTYAASADIYFLNPITHAAEPTIHDDIRDQRDLAFVDAGVGVGSFYLIGEAGLQRGKDLHLATTFAGNDPAANRFFASVGLRVGI